MNGDSKSTNERGPSLVGLVMQCWYRRFFSALAALVGLVQIIFSLTMHYLNSLSPSRRPSGWQAAVLGRLSRSMCLYGCNSGGGDARNMYF